MNLVEEIKHTFKRSSILSRFIYINLGIFLVVRIVHVFLGLFNIDSHIIEWLALPSDFATLITRPWTIITYMFLHFDFLHILFNVLWLYWFGKIFTILYDEKKLIGVYLFGGIMGGVFYILAFNFLPAFAETNQNSVLLGASASIIAIVMASAVTSPNYIVQLFLIGPVKIIWIALFSVIIYFISIPVSNPGGNIAHLGGAFWGFIYVLGLKRGLDMTKGVNNFVFNFNKIFFKRKPMKVTYRSNDVQKMTDWEYNSRKKIEQEALNGILEKISKSGYDSLSRQEKEILFRMGNENKHKHN